MHRIDGDNNLSNQFALADPGAGRTNGTTLTPDWLNDVQENIAAVIDGASIPLIKGDFGQLLVSIEKMLDAREAKFVGMIAGFPTTQPINGWLKLDGTAGLLRATYLNLFNFLDAAGLIGTEFGVGDGSTTFDLADVQGDGIRYFDESGLVDPGRTLMSLQVGNAGDHAHHVMNSTSLNFNVTGPTAENAMAKGNNVGGDISYSIVGTDNDPNIAASSGPIGSSAGDETVMRNRALTAYIKY